jgi:hypothetical protein
MVARWSLVVGSDSERIELDSSDLAGDLKETAARDLCARCGFTFLGLIDQPGGVEDPSRVSKTQANNQAKLKQNSSKTQAKLKQNKTSKNPTW